jgi:hypothetical protein
VTRRVWQYEFPKYELIISNVTISELAATKKKKDKKKLLDLVKNIKQVNGNSNCIALSNEYLKVLPIPSDDSSHVAIATFYNCDILLSWNFTHMVNFQNRMKINEINLVNGYRETNIISPYELGG